MSLADEIESQLNKIMDKLAESLGVEPGPERGLAWGENQQGRIVIPMHLVAKIAAGVAREHLVFGEGRLARGVTPSRGAEPGTGSPPATR